MSKLTKRGSTSIENVSGSVSGFLDELKGVDQQKKRGGLLFALDATMSRQPAWDVACSLQAQMFDAAAASGGLSIQLVYYRGISECGASRWVDDPKSLHALMSKIDCRGGQTQIRKVLAQAEKASQKRRVNAVIFVGDAMEENPDILCQRAGELGLKGIPFFMFQEGNDAHVTAVFKEIARLTKGAWFPFDSRSAAELGRLLKATARYAAGGATALKKSGEREDLLLLEQMRK